MPFRRNPNIEEVQAQLGNVLAAMGVNVNVLDAGSSHLYSCTCEACWQWWKQLGLGDEESPPFTQAQIDAETYEQAMEMRELGPVEVTEIVLQQHRRAQCYEDGSPNHLWVTHPVRRMKFCARCGLEVNV